MTERGTECIIHSTHDKSTLFRPQQPLPPPILQAEAFHANQPLPICGETHTPPTAMCMAHSSCMSKLAAYGINIAVGFQGCSTNPCKNSAVR